MTEGEQRQRVPRRIIHCNDGVVEEYSTDDDDDDEVDAATSKPPVNPVTPAHTDSSYPPVLLLLPR